VLHVQSVLTELHAVTIRGGLSFPYFLNFEDGRPLDPQATVHAKAMLEQLAWWASTSRKARAAVPYPG
jgi:hypothetical protein